MGFFLTSLGILRKICCNVGACNIHLPRFLGIHPSKSSWSDLSSRPSLREVASLVWAKSFGYNLLLVLPQYLVPSSCARCTISKCWKVFDVEVVVIGPYQLWVPWSFYMFCCRHFLQCFKHRMCNSLRWYGSNPVDEIYCLE